MAGPIRISILANASNAVNGIRSVSREADNMGGRLKGATGALAGFAKAGLAAAGLAAGAFAVASVKAASDAQQSLGATETVFGKFAKTVEKESNRAATAYGLSANTYRENANVLGALLKNQGVSQDKLAGKTKSLIGTASDLAATFGGTTTESVQALSSAFKGEFDPLEKYGISLKQSTVNAEALKVANVGSTSAFGKLSTAAQTAAKRQATMNLIQKQSASSAGAFARESDTLAHQQQVLGAQFDNIKVKVGTALLPILTKLLTFVNANLNPAFKTISSVVGPVVNAVKSFFTGLSSGTGTLSAVGSSFAGIKTAFQGVVTAFQTYYAVLIPIVKQVASAFVGAFRDAAPTLQSIFNSIKSVVSSALSIVASVVKGITIGISFVWKTFGATILSFATSTFKNIITVVGGALKIVSGIFKVVSSVLKGDWKGAWNGIKSIVSGATSVIKGIVSQFGNTVKTVLKLAWTAAKTATQAVWNGIKAVVTSSISNMMEKVKAIKGKVTGAFSGAASWLYSAGKNVVQGLINGIKAMASAAANAALNVVKGAISKAKAGLGIKSPSRVFMKIGKQTMQGLAIGFQNGSEGVAKSLDSVTKMITKALDKKYDGKQLKKRTKAVLGSLKGEFAALTANGKAQDRINAKLDAARSKLADIVKASQDYAANVKAAVVSTSNVVGLGVNEDGTVSGNSLLNQLKDRLIRAQRFTDLIKKLTKAGLNGTQLQNLISAGVDSGLATAEAIAAGGAGAIREINTLTAQITKVGADLGNSTAQTFYGAGIRAAEGLVRGLQSQAAQLDQIAARLAQSLIKAVKKALKIKSPSRVFRDLGRYTAKGLVIGLDQVNVSQAGRRMANSLTTGFGTPALDAYLSGSGSQAQTITLHLSADQIDQLQRGKELQAALDFYRANGGRAKAA